MISWPLPGSVLDNIASIFRVGFVGDAGGPLTVPCFSKILIVIPEAGIEFAEFSFARLIDGLEQAVLLCFSIFPTRE